VTLQESYNRLNFWVNKYFGSYYSMEDLTEVVESGQMSLYSDLQPQYATSERIKDALAPFRTTWDFTPSNTISGIIPIPTNLNILNLLDVTIQYTEDGRTRYVGIDMMNEDEKAARLNSQIDPVTITSPIGEVLSNTTINGVKQFYIRLYPTAGYTGTVTFLRKPVKPFFAYSVVGGRTIVYNASGSTQLEWADNWINPVLLKALNSIGINLSDNEIQQFGETKTMQNFQGVNRT